MPKRLSILDRIQARPTWICVLCDLPVVKPSDSKEKMCSCSPCVTVGQVIDAIHALQTPQAESL